LIFEVTPEGSTVWQYNTGGQLFKTVYIAPEEQEPPENDTATPELDCSGLLSWTNVEPGAAVTGSFKVQNIGDVNSTLNWTVNTTSITWGSWTFTPESGDNLTPGDGEVTIQVSVVAPDEGDAEFQGYIRVENEQNSSDYDTIPVYLKTPRDLLTIHMRIHQFFMKWIHFFSENLSWILQRTH
jgi:hypothetical protein